MKSFSGFPFVLFCFVFLIMFSLKPQPFVQSPFKCRRPDSHTRFFLSFSLLFILRCRFFRVFFVPLPFSLCMDSSSYVLSFRMVFFYLVTTDWIFDISLCGNSISQSVNQSIICTKFSGTNADREIFIFAVQLTTCRTGNLTRLIHTLAICVTIRTYTYQLRM